MTIKSHFFSLATSMMACQGTRLAAYQPSYPTPAAFAAFSTDLSRFVAPFSIALRTLVRQPREAKRLRDRTSGGSLLVKKIQRPLRQAALRAQCLALRLYGRWSTHQWQ